MRNGEKLRSLGVPTERRTRAPAPSDCSIARKDLAILRGAEVVNCSSGITGSPRNMPLDAMSVEIVVKLRVGVKCLVKRVKRESIYGLLYIAAAIAMTTKKIEESVFISQTDGLYSYATKIENLRRKGLRRSSKVQLS